MCLGIGAAQSVLCPLAPCPSLPLLLVLAQPKPSVSKLENEKAEPEKFQGSHLRSSVPAFEFRNSIIVIIVHSGLGAFLIMSSSFSFL